MRWLVTAAYANVVDQPQVYETTVEAETVEEAEAEARRICIEDNGGDPNDPDCTEFDLTDVFARPAAIEAPVTIVQIGDVTVDSADAFALVERGLLYLASTTHTFKAMPGREAEVARNLNAR